MLLPANDAVIKQDMQPANNALIANLENNCFCDGAIPPRIPSCIPIDEKLEKPHNA